MSGRRIDVRRRVGKELERAKKKKKKKRKRQWAGQKRIEAKASVEQGRRSCRGRGGGEVCGRHKEKKRRGCCCAVRSRAEREKETPSNATCREKAEKTSQMAGQYGSSNGPERAERRSLQRVASEGSVGTGASCGQGSCGSILAWPGLWLLINRSACARPADGWTDSVHVDAIRTVFYSILLLSCSLYIVGPGQPI